MLRRLRAAMVLVVVLSGCGAESQKLGASGRSFPSITEDGAWCWFADPRAIRPRGKHDRTYIGWVARTGDIKVGYHDHETGARGAVVVREKLERDDHANPALVALPNGHVMVFYSAHGGNRMFYRVSRNPEDVTAWWREREVPTNTRGRHGYTYPNPVVLRGEEDRVYLFWRGGNSKPSYATTRDGIKWTRARTLIRGKGDRPYVKVVSDGDVTIHFAFTDGHPRQEPTNSIYYAYYRSGTLHRADGLLIKSMDNLPLKPSESELVYDGRSGQGRAWIWDIALDMAGRPVIAYVVMPVEGDHRYRYARWTGTGWQNHDICSAGGWFPETLEGQKETEPHYSGGVVLDHADPSIVYLSRPVHGVFEIEQWVTSDGGKTWSSSAVTAGSRRLNVRPVLARGGLRDESLLFWLQGRYVHYTRFDTGIRMAVIKRPED